MDWNSIYKAYPVNQEMIWLNNCGTTPAGVHILEALTRFMEDYSRKGILTEVASYIKVQKRIKTILSKLLNCSPDELGLIHNTAEGINFISHGLDLSDRDEVILLENEYPSNVYPWKHLEKKGVILITAPMKRSPKEFFEALKGLITSRTRVIALSAVHWCTGMPLPLVRVGNICKEFGIDLVVDGAQGVGLQPLDVQKANIACMAFPAWKWLLGPLGLGMIYVSAEKLSNLEPIFIGTSSVVNDREYFPYRSELKPTADRFTISTANFNDWVYFAAALDFLQNIGFTAIRERILQLGAYLRQGLAGIGFKVFSDHFPDSPTGIIVCEKPGVESEIIMEHLRQNRIVAALRIGRIRFSPHVYISPEQLDEVLQVLKKV